MVTIIVKYDVKEYIISIKNTIRRLSKSNNYLLVLNDKLEIDREFILYDSDLDNCDRINDNIFMIANNYFLLYLLSDSDIIKTYSDIMKFSTNLFLNSSKSKTITFVQKYNNKYKLLAQTDGDTLVYTLNMKLISEIKILSILDEFSHLCFQYDCKLIPVSPVGYEIQIENDKPDFFFCESAWKAFNSEISLQDGINIKLVEDIIKTCNKFSIPTIFWNKEDDLHYYRYIEVAKLFDIILTTDERCIPNYIKDAGHDNVYCLEFGTQPKLHNPANNDRINDVLFAGQWYKNFTHRNKQIEYLIDSNLFESKYTLDIFDRKYKKLFPSFPEKYLPYLKKVISYNKLCKKLNTYKILFNVNSITGSATMFSRRVYEGMSAGCVVISTDSVGISKKFKDEVLISKSINNTNKYLNKLLKKKSNLFEIRSHKSYTRVINSENYYQRLKKICDIVGILYYDPSPIMVYILLIISKNDTLSKLQEFISNIQSQSYQNISIIIFCLDAESYKFASAIMTDNMKIKYIESIGDINKTLILIKDSYIIKMTIYDIYEVNFLQDSLYAFLFIDADTNMIGKNTFTDNNKKLYNKGNEHKYTTSLKENTIIFNKNNIEAVMESIINFNIFNENRKYKKYAVERWNYIYTNM